MTNKVGFSPRELFNSAEFQNRFVRLVSELTFVGSTASDSVDFFAHMTKPGNRAAELAKLVEALVPRDIDPDVWMGWSFGGETPHSVVGPKLDRRSTVHPSREAERAQGRASTARMRAEKFEAEAEALMAKAKFERDIEEAEMHSGRGLVLAALMLQVHQKFGGIFAMGPAWWILEALADLPGQKLVLRDIDALGSEADFRAELGLAIEAVCLKHRDRAVSSGKARGVEQVWTTMPDGVGSEAVSASMEKLKPGGVKAPVSVALAGPVGSSEISVPAVAPADGEAGEKPLEKPRREPKSDAENGPTVIDVDIVV